MAEVPPHDSQGTHSSSGMMCVDDAEEECQDLDLELAKFAKEGISSSLSRDDSDLGVYTLCLDYLDFADQRPALAAGLLHDPLGFRDALQDCLSDATEEDDGARKEILRLNVMPECLPGSQCCSMSKCIGSLTSIQGVVLGIESIRNEVFSRVVRCPHEFCSGFEPFKIMESGANAEKFSAFSCGICGRMLLEDVGKRWHVPARYLILGTSSHTCEMGAQGGGSPFVNRTILVRLCDSNARLRGVCLGSRLRIIGVPLVAEAAALSTTLTKMPPGITHAGLDSTHVIVFCAWSLFAVEAAQVAACPSPPPLGAHFPSRPARRVPRQGAFDSPAATRREANPHTCTFSLLNSASSACGPTLDCISERDMEDAAEDVQRVLDWFLPGVPFPKLRLCVLLSFVSGDPVIPLEEATGVRQSIHVLVNCCDAMPEVNMVLNAAKHASQLPCEWVRSAPEASGILPKFVPEVDKAGWRLETCQLLQANGGVALFGDIRGVKKATEVAALGSVLSSQAMGAGKDQCSIAVPCRTAVIAVLSSDQTKNPIPADWLRSFDLCVDMNEAPDVELDDAMCKMVFDVHARSEGGSLWENAETLLSASLLASSRLDVNFSPPAHVLMTAFFKATRQAMALGNSSGGYYQLETLTRIASAFAKLRHADAIEAPDVIMAIDLNEETRAAKGLFSVLSYRVLHNDKANSSMMHGDRPMALLKLSQKIFALCYAYGTLSSEE